MALLISALAGACGAPGAPTSPRADRVEVVLLGGDVRTMDPARPRAQAVAIAGGRIVAVGTDAEVSALADGSTKRIDLSGHTVTPGLIDAHAHLYGLGVDAEAVSVRALPSEGAAVEVVAAAAQARPAGEWLLGRGWDQNRWPGQQFPTKATLDAVVRDRPVLLRRVDGHAAWVNSAALAAAGITKATKDPAGGKIVRDAAGEPTGVLIDNAIELVDAKVPTAPADVRERRILAAAKLALASGLTAVHDMGIEDATADVYASLARDGRLPIRVYAFYGGDATKPDRLKSRPAAPVGSFEMSAVKFFADGALGSRGARLHAPYTDDTANHGLWVTDPETLANGVDVAVAHGWQVGIHAIGDAAIDAVLDAYEAASAKHPGARRMRVEHTQVIAPADISRMAKSKIIASMQPTHATSDMPWAEARVGADRIAGAYAWRTLLDAGVPLAAGSDFPVEDVAPLLGIYAAVTRQDASGQPPGGWRPEQTLTLDEAIAAFTVGAAYAEGHEDSRGVIAPGRAADITVFDRALAADRTLLETKVDYTIVDGRIAYAREVAR